jgi:type VI protein secretion system component Hcp
MPQYQNLGGHWHLTGSLKRTETGIPVPGLNQLSQGNGQLTLERRIDAFSPHISVAKTNQLVIPKLTVTTSSGQPVTFHHVHIKEQNDTNELEKVSFTFRKIEISGKVGKKSHTDDWLSGG